MRCGPLPQLLELTSPVEILLVSILELRGHEGGLQTFNSTSPHPAQSSDGDI